MNQQVTTYRQAPRRSRSNCAPAYYQGRPAELVTSLLSR
jgi:hypothetical protein